MRNWGKAPQMLVALNCVCFSVAHADDAAPVTTPVATTARLHLRQKLLL